MSLDAFVRCTCIRDGKAKPHPLPDRLTFDESGEPINPATDMALGITLEDLAWFANALGRARAEGQLLPGTFRARAAAAAAAAD